jgi:hypothetical protein
MNEEGVSLPILITPPWWNTTWFRVSSVAAFLMLIWGLYRYRLHQLAQEFNMRLEERIEERTRIARELHDTLLQSFQGLVLRFQTVRNLLPARVAEAAKVLDNAQVAMTLASNAAGADYENDDMVITIFRRYFPDGTQNRIQSVFEVIVGAIAENPPGNQTVWGGGIPGELLHCQRTTAGGRGRIQSQ